MAVFTPFVAAAASAAVYGSKHNNNNNTRINIDINQNRELYKKREYIKEYLEKKFKVEKVEYFEDRINFTIYRLLFWFGGIGIQLSNEMIVMYGKDNLCDYCYNLILEQLYKNTKEKYVNDYE